MNAKKPEMSNQPAFPLERVHQLAASYQFVAFGRKAVRDMETYFGGRTGFAKVLGQLTTREFHKTVRDDLPSAYEKADVYRICLDEELNKVTPNIHDMRQCEYYLKILVDDDKVLVSLSNHI